MNKKIILTMALILSGYAFSQVGVNTPLPKATLDIKTKNPTGTSINPEGLLIPRIDRQEPNL